MRLETDRLILRPWQESDHAAFIAMSADPEVMKYFPQPLTQAQSLAFIQQLSTIMQQNQWGFWAVELKQSGEFIGFIGLAEQTQQFPFSPCVEIAWRLAKAFWRQGYATEGAQAALNYAFQTLKLNKVVSFTAAINHPSEAVMQRLNMHKVTEFNHPKLASAHPLEKHVLYEILNPQTIIASAD